MEHVIRPFRPEDTDAVVALWESCGLVRPWNDPRRDIARKLTVQPELFLVAEGRAGVDREAVVAAGMAGFDGHRGWVNYLAVRPDLQGGGLGRAMMAEFERLLTDMGCPKLNLQVRAGNEQVIAFYESLGYAPDHAVSLGKRLVVDGVGPDPHAAVVERTGHTA
ncbi:GNAT family acetyltransferase [Curtobacterium sp. MCBD17_032]|uniref:GNAT family acetyltransferase n=1 Tax=Curtobacterium sp. MCBD17_032 TaxID=2175659 RepID=UPI000DA7842E|nr:GNAT family acetyltransferase [Curtobacterium sp. MCBD17_032]PZE86345.1 GNAT family acetyltransferase [Curtobacterium sp. MCBD17_032]